MDNESAEKLGNMAVDTVFKGIANTLGKEICLPNADTICKEVRENYRQAIKDTISKTLDNCRILHESGFSGWINKEFVSEFYLLGTRIACELADKYCWSNLVSK